MAVNPFFNFTNFSSEQTLIEDLIVEAIQIYGHDAYYIPRSDNALDLLLGEDPLSSYGAGYSIELYLKSSDSFQGQSEFMSKFGLQIEDQATFLMAARRFDELGTGLFRPRENDIIYIQMTPTNRYLFEIRFVENKEQLFQLGKLYTYELRCEMMNFSNERVASGIPEADELALTKAYAQALSLDLPSGNGNFVVGESVAQGTLTATVSAWVANTGILTVSFLGEDAFLPGLPLVGATSNAQYNLYSARLVNSHRPKTPSVTMKI
jgi:hypothetical protein